MKRKNIALCAVAFLVLATVFTVLKIQLVGSPALALRQGQAVYKNISSDQIVVDSISTDDKVVSPLTIVGKAKAPWYYEGAFSVLILDANGVALGRGSAQADTVVNPEGLTPFTAQVVFTPTSGSGTVVLTNDNPDNLADSQTVSIPVSFE